MNRLEAILEQAIRKALETASARAETMALEALEPVLRGALEAKIKALLGDETPAIETPVKTARAKATQAQALESIDPQAILETTPAKPRKRKAKAEVTPQEDLTTVMEGVKAALEKYAHLTTPKGKPLPDVLSRRIRKVLEYAGNLGRKDLAPLARSALAVISADPMGAAMRPWPHLAATVGLPNPLGQEE
jgi:hypothetical protein